MSHIKHDSRQFASYLDKIKNKCKPVDDKIGVFVETFLPPYAIATSLIDLFPVYTR
jgi:hypothetical protein